jgi:hypothetical protein
MKNSGCRGFVGERYDVRGFFSAVLRENVILGIQVLFSTHPRHITWPRNDTKYRNTNALSTYRRRLSGSSSRSPYTFQLISEKRTSQVEGGRRPFARRNITSLELVWSSSLLVFWSYELTLSCEGKCSGLQPRRGSCHVYWTITLLLIFESCGSSGSCHLLTIGHIHSVGRFHGK